APEVYCGLSPGTSRPFLPLSRRTVQRHRRCPGGAGTTTARPLCHYPTGWPGNRRHHAQEYPMKSITIDRSKRLKDDPQTGHNRWHPDIPPILEVDPGEEVVLETRDASDCQIQPGMTVADLASLDAKVAHPLTGPVYIKGARPGDLLEIEYLDIVPQPHGWTRNCPGAGFLRDLFTEPYLVHWEIKDGWATSPQLPGVRIPNGSFMGTAGIAPSRAQLDAWARREADLVARGGIAFLPDPQDAGPAPGPVGQEGVGTLPPPGNFRELEPQQPTQRSRL